MSMNRGAGTAELMAYTERILLSEYGQQTDADGHIFRSGEVVSIQANNSHCWRWKLLRTGDSLFNFCIQSLSDRPVTLSSVVLYVSRLFERIVLTEKYNIGQPSYQSGDFSVANSWPRFDEWFRGNLGGCIRLEVVLEWSETATAVRAAPVPMSPASLIESQLTKVMDGGDSVYELVSSDGQSFSVNGTILEAKSGYFERFFATEGWKEQMEGRMPLPWTSAVVKQLIRYVYLNTVDGDVCALLPDILDGAQIWELVGMKAVIEAQMRERLQKAARDADTDTAVEYLKMADLHQLTSLMPLCNDILAANFDKF